MTNEPQLALPEDAPQLVELYCKALKSAAMDKGPCAEENRPAFIQWLRDLCTQQKLWIIDDNGVPVALMHLEPDKSEIVSVVTKDGSERKGLAATLIESAQAREKYLTGIPVTRGGKGLMTKCGFVSRGLNESNWDWRWKSDSC